MIRVRISFDKKEEVVQARRVAKIITKCLGDKYDVYINKKIYWNTREKKKGKKNFGGRIYILLREKR